MSKATDKQIDYIASPTLGYEYDDGGRAASGRKGRADDCAARAMAIITQRPYADCYRLLAAEEQRYSGVKSARNGVTTRACDKVYRAAGLRKVKLPAGPRPTWAEAHQRYGDCLVTTSHHIAALVGGCLRDTTDRRYYDWDGVQRQRKAASVWVYQHTDTGP